MDHLPDYPFGFIIRNNKLHKVYFSHKHVREEGLNKIETYIGSYAPVEPFSIKPGQADVIMDSSCILFLSGQLDSLEEPLKILSEICRG